MALTTSSALPSISRLSSLGVCTTPIRSSIRGNLVGHADPLGVQPPIEARALPLLVPHPLEEDDRQRDERRGARRRPTGSRRRAAGRRAATLPTSVTTCEYQPDASTRVAAEQRDADERVERQQHEHVEQPGAVSEAPAPTGRSPTTYPMNRKPTTTKCVWTSTWTTVVAQGQLVETGEVEDDERAAEQHPHHDRVRHDQHRPAVAARGAAAVAPDDERPGARA